MDDIRDQFTMDLQDMMTKLLVGHTNLMLLLASKGIIKDYSDLEQYRSQATSIVDQALAKCKDETIAKFLKERDEL